MQADRPLAGISVAGDLRINRNQPVLAARFDPMTSVEHGRGVSPGSCGCKIDERLVHLGEVAVDQPGDIEPELLQGVRDVAGVTRRVRQRRHLLIGAIADHECDTAPVGLASRASQHGKVDRKCQQSRKVIKGISDRWGIAVLHFAPGGPCLFATICHAVRVICITDSRPGPRSGALVCPVQRA